MKKDYRSYMLRRLFSVVLIIAMAGSMIAGCAGHTPDTQREETVGTVLTLDAADQSTQGGQDETKSLAAPTIGVAFAGADASYQIMLAGYLEEAAKEKNISLEIKYANWDAKVQQKQLETFLQQGKNAIILCPVNAKSLLTPLKEAKKAGIPVINMNMKVDDISTEYVSTYVGASSTEEAVLAAQMAESILGEAGGQVGIIEGTPGTDPQIFRTAGFFDTIASRPDIKVVEIGESYWNREKAYKQALTMILHNPSLKLIYAQDSEMAMGAVRAVREKGLTGQISVIGIGEGKEYVDAVKDGSLYGFIYQDAAFEARQSLTCAIMAIEGEKLRPWYRNTVRMITRENVSELKS